jgi:hypothetical protein
MQWKVKRRVTLDDNDDFQEMFSRINRENVDFIFPIWVNLALIKSPKTKPFFFSHDFFDSLFRTYWNLTELLITISRFRWY